MISGYDTSSTSTAQDYLQNSLTVLSFLDEGASSSSETSTSSTVLPVNETGTLNLLPYYEPGSTSTVNDAYNLLISQSNNYFPVATAGEINLLRGFPAISVPQASPCNSSSAANAYVFLQNMMAYPSSTLAQGFTTALSADTNSTSSSEATNVNAFFAGTTDFTNVTFSVYTAVTSYVSAYAYVWANFQSSYTYHFYTTTPTSSTASSSTDSTNVKVDAKVTLLGTVEFQQSGSLPAEISDANAGYTITWTPAGGSATSLTYSNGQLTNANSDGFSSMCFQCTFMDMGILTGNSADSGTPIQAMTGLINGTNVIGSPVTLKQTVSEDISKGLTTAMSSNIFRGFQLVFALYMGIELSVKLCSWVKAKCFKKQPPTEDEIEEKQTELQDNAEEQLKDAGNSEEVPTGEQLSERQERDNGAKSNAEAEGLEGEELDGQAKQIQDQLQEGNDDEIQNEINSEEQGIDELEGINPASGNAPEEIQGVQDNINNNQNQINAVNEAQGNAANQQAEEQAKVVQQDGEIVNQEDGESENEGGKDGEGEGEGEGVADIGDF